MGDAKHTPGPWEWDAGDAGVDYSVPYAVILPIGRDAVIAEFNDRIPEGRANARLIASAPEMLEALALWQAADAETDEAARQVARQIAREKRDAALAKAMEAAP